MKASMDAQQLKILEHRADELIRLCSRMDQEIRSLKATERMLREERSMLMRKNEDARSKVEAMIMRLRSLEQDS
jgi:cell division protein ZapB